MDKDAVRADVWDTMEETGVARFPYPPHGRIPNFEDADRAADRLASLDEWESADVVKANPDAPQLPVRRAALHAGKTVYMAVPRLRHEQCFIRLNPAELDDPDRAATIGGSEDAGVQIGPDDVEPIDLIVVGSVAVTRDGFRIGKGEGYSDLEYAILSEFGLIDGDVPVTTTVHDIQVLDDDGDPDPHDVPLDRILTPSADIDPPAGERPTEIDWSCIDSEQLNEMPVLDRLKPTG